MELLVFFKRVLSFDLVLLEKNSTENFFKDVLLNTRRADEFKVNSISIIHISVLILILFAWLW
jgi:hypothetical protein